MQEAIKRLLPIELAFSYLSARDLIKVRGICREWNLLVMNELDKRRVWNSILDPKFICPSGIRHIEMERIRLNKLVPLRTKRPASQVFYDYLSRQDVTFENVSTLYVNSFFFNMEKIVDEFVAKKMLPTRMKLRVSTYFLRPETLQKMIICCCEKLQDLTLEYYFNLELGDDFFSNDNAYSLNRMAKNLRSVTFVGLDHNNLLLTSYKLLGPEYLKLLKIFRMLNVEEIVLDLNFCLHVKQFLGLVRLIFGWPKTRKVRMRGQLVVKQRPYDEKTKDRVIMYEELKKIVGSRDFEVMFIDQVSSNKQFLAIHEGKMSFEISEEKKFF